MDKELRADSIRVLLGNTRFFVRSTSRATEPPTAGHRVQDHLRKLKVWKSMDPDEMCLMRWVLREPVEEVAKPLSIIYDKMWQSSETPTNGRRKIRKAESVSPLRPVTGMVVLETVLRCIENKEVIVDSQYTFNSGAWTI